MTIKSFLLLVCFIPFIPFIAHSIDLTPEEKEKIGKGEITKDVKWMKNFVWPKVTMKSVIPGTPEQNMAGFTQWEKHTSFIPDLIKSKVVKVVSPTQTHVACELKVPWPVNKSAYTTNNVVTTSEDGTKTLTWNMVKGDMIKATDGHMTFSPYEGKTLMEYESLIVPNSSFAGMFKNKVPEDVEKSVKAIIKHLKSTLPEEQK